MTPMARGAVQDDFATPEHLDGAWAVLRRGLRESPELKRGALYTVGLAVVSTVGALVLPVLLQQILDHGLRATGGVNLGFVYATCALAALGTVVVYFAGRLTYRRLVESSEAALRSLRVRTFAHIHDLSIAEQTAEKRGVFVARVTADVDTLSQFMQWAGISWITGSILMLGTLAVMAVYSIQLTLIVVATIAPMGLVLRLLQKRLLTSYDLVRTRVGETLSEISESVMGADVVRAYGLDERVDRRLKRAIRRQFQAQMRAMKYQSMSFPAGNVFGGLAAGAVLVAGVTWGQGWGLSPGRVVAFLFLVNLILQPLSEIAENFDQTQTAIAGWRKILAVMDIPIDVVEPLSGVSPATSNPSIVAQNVRFSYRDGPEVLHGITLGIEAGSHVAIVGETGCGKTTFAKLLSRLADPSDGRICLDDVDLRAIAPDERRRLVRMVPQDGFLFDGTIGENVRYGSAHASDRDVDSAFRALGLKGWVDTLPSGLETPVGQRGENLSAGEAQLVSLARAQIARPSVLILDEATSAVDPETERRLAEALERLAEGRTTVTIAHRLSTAEASDWVFVFDAGRLIESGRHRSLVAADGKYASLYQSWLGTTRTASHAG